MVNYRRQNEKAGNGMTSKNRAAWNEFAARKQARCGQQFIGNVRTAKGMGPNKACGHKGGISRQGSKR